MRFKDTLEEEDNVFQPIKMDQILDVTDQTDNSVINSKMKRSDSRKSIVLVKDIDYLEQRITIRDYCRFNYSKGLLIGKNIGKKK